MLQYSEYLKYCEGADNGYFVMSENINSTMMETIDNTD